MPNKHGRNRTKKRICFNSIHSAGDRIFRLPDVLALVGLSKPSIYRQMAAGTFPKAIKLGDRAVGWRASTIQDWMDSREVAA